MIVLVGASATGKTEVGKTLNKLYNIKKVVTYTTRDLRVNEKDGIDYHFISKEKFLELKESGFFFETVCYNDNYYGTSKESLKTDSYVICEFSGLNNYLNSKLDIMTFYLFCDEDIRISRMLKRGDQKEDALRRIEIDRDVFKDDIKNRVSYSIDVSSLTVEEVASKVYKLSHQD